MSKLVHKPAFKTICETNAEENQRTLVVLGAARGGTSMIAGALRLLGVNMGTHLNSSHENRKFRQALLGNRSRFGYALMPLNFYSRYCPLLKHYNHRHSIWGIKDPTLNPYLPWLARYWCNPVYILVLRNPIATAESQAAHFQQPFVKVLNQVLTDYQKLYRFALATKRPFLVQQKGYQWISDDNTKLVGFIEKTSAQQISGWAFNPQTSEPVTLVLHYAGLEITHTIADKPRQDVLENAAFKRLLCGFIFDLSSTAEKLNLNKIQIVDKASGLTLIPIKP
jgi:hypothetical protein